MQATTTRLKFEPDGPPLFECPKVTPMSEITATFMQINHTRVCIHELNPLDRGDCYADVAEETMIRIKVVLFQKDVPLVGY